MNTNPSRFHRAMVAALAFTAMPISNAQESPRITGTEIRVVDEALEVRVGDPVRIDESRVLVFDGPPGLPSIVPLPDLIAISTSPVTTRSTTLSNRNDAARAGDDSAIKVPYLELVDGQRIPGSLRSTQGGRPVWRSAWLRDIEFDLDRISRLSLSDDGRPVPRAVDADVVMLVNGDRIDGLVESIGTQVDVEVDRPGGEPGSVRIPLDRIASISLVNPMEIGSGAMTWLRGGHRIRSESIRILGDGYLTLVAPMVGGDSAEIPLEFLVAAVLESDRLHPLATQDDVIVDPGPAGEIRAWIPMPKTSPGHHAYDASPIRMDGPLRATYELPVAGGRLATTIERPMESGPGRLVFRVLDDGRTIHSVEVDQDEPVHRIVVDFESDRLGFEIDSGDDGPFHDSIVLHEAIIVRPRD